LNAQVAGFSEQGKRKTLSCRFTTGAFGLPAADRRHVKLPRIGLVRTHGMMKNPRLARHVASVGMGELRRQVDPAG
jgi:hypothetical protein